jgi:transcriptional regulator with XRE-family HTH domain
MKEGVNRMAFDYSKLKGRIVEKYGNQCEFAKALGCSERTLSLKMNGKVPWKQPEIISAMRLLELENENIQEYFFTLKVQNF